MNTATISRPSNTSIEPNNFCDNHYLDDLLSSNHEIKDLASWQISRNTIDAPGNNLILANVCPSIIRDPDDNNLCRILLNFLNPEEQNNGYIRISSLTEEQALGVLEFIFLQSEFTETFEISDKADKKYERLEPRALENILNQAKILGATVASSFGRDTKSIIKAYDYRSQVQEKREDCENVIYIDRNSHMLSENPNTSQDNISWVDIKTTACNRLDSFEKIEAFLRSSHPDTIDKNSKYSLLDLRIIEPADSDCQVERHKLFILVGADRLVTIHEGESFCLELVKDKFKNGGYRNLSTGSNPAENGKYKTIGSGFVLARIVEKVIDDNENTLRFLENTVEQILRQIEESQHTGLDKLLQDILDMQRTARFVERKMSDAVQNFRKFTKFVDLVGLEKISSLDKAEVQERMHRLETSLEDLAERAKRLVERTNDVNNFHTQQISMHTDAINTKIAVLGAVLGPVLTAIGFVEILPTLVETPKYSLALLLGACASVGLFCMGKLKKFL